MSFYNSGSYFISQSINVMLDKCTILLKLYLLKDINSDNIDVLWYLICLWMHCVLLGQSWNLLRKYAFWPTQYRYTHSILNCNRSSFPIGQFSTAHIIQWREILKVLAIYLIVRLTGSLTDRAVISSSKAI